MSIVVAATLLFAVMSFAGRSDAAGVESARSCPQESEASAQAGPCSCAVSGS